MMKADLARHLHHFSSPSFGWLLPDTQRVVCVGACLGNSSLPSSRNGRRDDQKNFNQTQARVFPISLAHMPLPCKRHVWETQHRDDVFRREERQEIQGIKALVNSGRARDGLLGQNQEAGQAGHIPFPLTDELIIQNVDEGRKRHLFFIGSSNEHAESVPMVGQFQNVVVMAIRGRKLSCKDTKIVH